jgi:hypothetical protein
MDRLVDAHFRAEARGDVAGVLATCSDIEHDTLLSPPDAEPGTARPTGGDFSTRLFGEIVVDSDRSVRRWYGSDHPVDDGVMSAKALDHPFGFDGRGRRVTFQVLHVFDFVDGRIARESGWPGAGTIGEQLA